MYAYDKEENIPIHLEEDKTKMIQTRTPPEKNMLNGGYIDMAKAGMQNNKEIRHPSRGVSPIPACAAVGMMMCCRGSLSSCVPAHGDKLPANISYST